MRMAGAHLKQSLFGDMGSPDFSGLSNMGQKARAEEGITAMKSDAMLDNAHMTGAAKVEMAKMQADAIGAQGDAAMQSAIGQGIGQIGGMFGSVIGGMGGGNVTPSTTSLTNTQALQMADIGGYSIGSAAAPKFRGNLFGGN